MNLSFRSAVIGDADLYYKWAQDPIVRRNSFQQSSISYEDHIKWFTGKLAGNACKFYLFFNSDVPVGQIRIDIHPHEAVISLSIDEVFRGMGLGKEMINMACIDFWKSSKIKTIVAYIKQNNVASYKIFEKAGFGSFEKIIMSECPAFRLTKSIK